LILSGGKPVLSRHYIAAQSEDEYRIQGILYIEVTVDISASGITSWILRPRPRGTAHKLSRTDTEQWNKHWAYVLAHRSAALNDALRNFALTPANESYIRLGGLQLKVRNS
jgi:hypothetical protein